MSKPPPTREEILDLLRRTTDPSYHEPFFEDERGAIAQYRGLASTNAALSVVVGRSADRQFFISPPGRESAGPSTRATSAITFRRSIDTDVPIIVAAGALTLLGPNQRLYRSTEDVVWYTAPDPNLDRVVVVECDLIGELGNLDLAADDDGKLTHPVTGAPETDVLDLRHLSQTRAGLRAVLTVVSGELSVLTSPGAAPTWGPDDVGLFVRFNFAGDPANVGRVLRIVGWSIASTAGDDGFYARSIVLDDGPQPYLVSGALLDDGGVFTHYTAAAQAGEPNTVVLLPTVPVVGDRFLFGADFPFPRLQVEITQRRYGDLVLVWEWWDGAVWQPAQDLIDGSDGFTVEGWSLISHKPDGGWVSSTIDGRTAYWLSARVDVFTSQALQPLAGRLVVLLDSDLVSDPLDTNGEGQIGWSVLDFHDMGITIVDMPAPAGGRDDDLGLKLAERMIRRRPHESLDVLRRRASRFPDVVTIEMLTWEVNRILEPLGLAGEIIDLGTGFTGMFYDVPPEAAPDCVGAYDLYEPGDVFPTNQTFVMLSEHELRWHFWVRMTASGLGEFGGSYDEGPVLYVEEFGEFEGPAFDNMFFDGYAAVASSAYQAVYERLQEAKAAGIAFTMILGDVAACP